MADTGGGGGLGNILTGVTLPIRRGGTPIGNEMGTPLGGSRILKFTSDDQHIRCQMSK